MHRMACSIAHTVENASPDERRETAMPTHCATRVWWCHMSNGVVHAATDVQYLTDQGPELLKSFDGVI